MSDLTIVGGGATGLVTAYIAAKAGENVTIVEGNSRLGGLLACCQTAGDPLEFFYHHFFTHDAEILWLLQELGLSDKLHFQESVMGVFRNKKIYNFSTPLDLLKFSPLSLVNKARFAATSMYLSRIKSWRDYEHISALEWFYQWAGKAVTENIWRPMLEIKFGNYANEVPIAWMIGRLSQRLSSRDAGKEKLGYIHGSLQELVNALERSLISLGVQIRTGTKVARICTNESGVSGLELEGGEVIAAGKVLCTVPGPYIAGMLDDKWQGLKDELNSIEYFGAICMLLFMKKPLSHVYWLNVADPGYPFGGVIEHTNFVDPARYGNQHIAYLSRYIENDNPLATRDTDQIAKEWLEYIPKIYPAFSPDDLIETRVFRTATAATVCDKNFSKRVPSVKTSIDGLYIANMAHVYPDERSVNNSIRIAASACSLMGIAQNVPKNKSMSAQIGFGE